MKNPDYVRLRNEHSMRKESGYYAEHLGTKCINCGVTENITYHHIVPLAVCGTNNLSNIVPVCVKCHKSIHGVRSHEEYDYSVSTGRKSTATEDKWDEVLSDYSMCHIGTKEAQRRLKRSGNAHLTDAKMYKQFLSVHGIKKIKNNLDIIRTNGKGVPDKGDVVGYIELTTGHRIEMLWQ